MSVQGLEGCLHSFVVTVEDGGVGKRAEDVARDHRLESGEDHVARLIDVVPARGHSAGGSEVGKLLEDGVVDGRGAQELLVVGHLVE